MITDDTLQERRELATIISRQAGVAMAAYALGAQNTRAEMSSAVANARLCEIYGVKSLLDSQEACEFLDEEDRLGRRSRGIGWVGLRRARKSP